MNTIIFCAIVSLIIYACGGIMYIKLPFSKILKISIVDVPVDMEWKSLVNNYNYVNNTNDTEQKTATYLTPYNLAMLIQ